MAVAGSGGSAARAPHVADGGCAQRSGSRRRARPGRARRARLPPRPRLGGRRLPRRRGVLHPQRLPHHPAPAGRADPHGARRRLGVHEGAGAAAAARARHVRARHAGPVRLARAHGGAAGRRAGLAALRPELAPRAGGPAVLRGVRAAVAAAAPVVAVGGGAAVPAVAAVAGRGAGDGAPVHRAPRHHPVGVRVGGADGACASTRTAARSPTTPPTRAPPGSWWAPRWRGCGGRPRGRARCRAPPGGASTPPGSWRWSRWSWGSWPCRSSTRASTARAGSCGSGCSPRW